MHTLIIAEAGVNHNGSLNTAMKLIDEAANAGCDAIKFQSFKADNIIVRGIDKAEYQKKNTGGRESQHDMLKKLELDFEEHKLLFEYCKTKGIRFMSSPFDEDAADMLESLGVSLMKIPSGEITNKPLLQHVARKGIPLILSTGMSTMGEVEEALRWIYETGNNDVILLHCTSDYPARYGDVNLRAMVTMREAFKVRTGYSDHTEGIEVPIAAAALGAEVIEKHFTLDRNMEGPDHKASIEPQELSLMVKAIRNVGESMGNGIKRPAEAELKTRDLVRKSIVSRCPIKKGCVIDKSMLCLKRPGTGIPPGFLDRIAGCAASGDIEEDRVITWKDIVWNQTR